MLLSILISIGNFAYFFQNVNWFKKSLLIKDTKCIDYHTFVKRQEKNIKQGLFIATAVCNKFLRIQKTITVSKNRS